MERCGLPVLVIEGDDDNIKITNPQGCQFVIWCSRSRAFNIHRFRCITVGFRVSPEEHEHINKAVALSGLSKQEYCYRRCLERDIVVQGNPKVYKALKEQLAEVLEELKRIEAGQSVNDELLENINLITRTLQGLNK